MTGVGTVYVCPSFPETLNDDADSVTVSCDGIVNVPLTPEVAEEVAEGLGFGAAHDVPEKLSHEMMSAENRVSTLLVTRIVSLLGNSLRFLLTCYLQGALEVGVAPWLAKDATPVPSVTLK